MISLETWTGAQALARLDDVMTVYAEAFLDVFEADPARARRERRVHVGAHLARPDLAFVAALEDGALVGMTYGVPGRSGNWWHDVVSRALSPADSELWMGDVWEIVELHVRPAWQGRGLGRELLRASLELSTNLTAALSALDDPSLPARNLYATEGFIPLLTDFAFPGGTTRYAILGKQLRTAATHDQASPGHVLKH